LIFKELTFKGSAKLLLLEPVDKHSSIEENDTFNIGIPQQTWKTKKWEEEISRKSLAA
jgi:hypothetical protein